MAEELRSETSRVLTCDLHLRPSVNREEAQALKELGQDKDRVIVTAGKGVAMVILDKQDCIYNAQTILVQRTHIDH